MRRVHRRKRPIDYILPFLVIVSLGVIGVMGWQVWDSWNRQGEADVYFYLADGKAKVLPYGETEWSNAFSGTRLLLGDALKTSSTGRAVVEFFNDTRIRLDYDTAMTLADVSKASDRETIAVNLDNGSVWVNGQKSAGVREAHYEVRTSDMLVRATGTIFEVERSEEQVVRVFDGDVKVDILIRTNGQERVADTIAVGVGQEITLDEATLRAFAENKTPSVLKAISDEFKAGAWYRWNTKEDSYPTDFSFSSPTDDTESVGDEELPAEETEATAEGESAPSDEEDVANNDVAGDSSAGPRITAPTDTTTDLSSFVISGTVPSGTAEVIVNSSLGDYKLSKFQKGDTSWSYNVSEVVGNLKRGENTYKVYAVDEDGNKSKPAEIVITYEKEAAEITDDLTDPKVLTYNGSDSSVVETGTVTVIGSVQGAEKVVVNGYTLSQFNPGDTQWKYVASESLGNLVPGENEFEVYGMDPDGNKSSVVKFTVTYNKPESGASQPPAEESAPAGSSSSVDYGF